MLAIAEDETGTVNLFSGSGEDEMIVNFMGDEGLTEGSMLVIANPKWNEYEGAIEMAGWSVIRLMPVLSPDGGEYGADSFYMTPITDEIFARIQGKSFKDDCTLPREDLRYLHVLHVDLNGETHEGEMIVNVHIAEDILDIFKQLYDAKYPIEKIRLVDEYDADDESSMEDNNSSAFNFRFISHTTRVSKHGLGLAVDINTLYNPYTKVVDGERIVEPVTGEPYLDREADFPYKIGHEGLCYQLFTEHGFEWGGDWEDRKDYQHFEIPTSQIDEWYP